MYQFRVVRLGRFNEYRIQKESPLKKLLTLGFSKWRWVRGGEIDGLTGPRAYFTNDRSTVKSRLEELVGTEVARITKKKSKWTEIKFEEPKNEQV